MTPGERDLLCLKPVVSWQVNDIIISSGINWLTIRDQEAVLVRFSGEEALGRLYIICSNVIKWSQGVRPDEPQASSVKIDGLLVTASLHPDRLSIGFLQHIELVEGQLADIAGWLATILGKDDFCHQVGDDKRKLCCSLKRNSVHLKISSASGKRALARLVIDLAGTRCLLRMFLQVAGGHYGTARRLTGSVQVGELELLQGRSRLYVTIISGTSRTSCALTKRELVQLVLELSRMAIAVTGEAAALKQECL